MMRIVAGKYRHRIISWPEDQKHIRPTKDRVREAIFSALGNLDGAIVLDLYSGSGAMGIEALSRNAKKCYFVDINQTAINTTKTNLKSLNIVDEAVVLKAFDIDALKSFINNVKFDLIILDPPYKEGKYQEIISYLENNNLLNENSIIVCESNYHLELQTMDYRKDKEYSYGEVKVRILWR